jgi:starch phosphorylase
MKFMLNGAITIGTLDGANVEILEEVGQDNIFIFGLTAQEAIDLTRRGDYKPWDLNANPRIHAILDRLIDGALAPNEPNIFRSLYDSMLGGHRPDEYFNLKDFESYREAQSQVDKAYMNKERWIRMAITNTACSGKFSSDRTIRQYANDVWHLSPVGIN